ncbi:MAG TPA: hypothetical protein VGK02_03445 [Candidatus Aquicultor sp.]|jgi:hypothetical protein
MARACTQTELETFHQDVEAITQIVSLDDAKTKLVEKFMADPVFRAKAEENRAVFMPFLDKLPSTWVMTRFLRICDEALAEL